MISSAELIIKVKAETGNGIKLLQTMASAVALPTETWLGIIKKKTAWQ